MRARWFVFGVAWAALLGAAAAPLRSAAAQEPPAPQQSDPAGGGAEPDAAARGPATTRAPVVRTEEPPYGTVRALCIGINEYPAGPVAGMPLAFAENDARELARTFRDAFGYEARELLGAAATRTGIETALAELAQRSGPRDVAIVYFAGHGATVSETRGDGHEARVAVTGYLLPQDVPLTLENRDDPAVYRTSAIDMRALALRLASAEQLPAKHVLLILDCCCSGYAVQSRGGAVAADDAYLRALAESESRQVITAGKKDEKSYEYPESDASRPRHGIFTATLLELLQADADAARARSVLALMPELQQRVFERVRAYANATVVPQRQVLLDTGGDYVFVPLSAPAWSESVAAQVTPGGGATRGTAVTTPEEFEAVTADARRSEEGQDLSQDAAAMRRVRDLELRAANGDTAAMEALVLCYRSGVGAPRDAEHATYWAVQAHESGSARGTFLFGEQLAADDAGIRGAHGAAVAELLNRGLDPGTLTSFRRWLPGARGRRATDAESSASGITRAASSVFDYLRATSERETPQQLLDRVRNLLDARRVAWDDVRAALRDWQATLREHRALDGENETDRAIRQLVGTLLVNAAHEHDRAAARTTLDELTRWFESVETPRGGR